jgi:hypothetical protein
MKSLSSKTKFYSFLGLGALALIGTYNALMISADSLVSSNLSAFKRLDEVQGIIVEGRTIATSSNWEKVSTISATKVVKTDSKNSISEPSIESAVKEELNLALTELVNPRLWKNSVAKNFSGSIFTNNGVIENLNVSLPGGEKIEVTFAELEGNVFQYELEGQVYSGMLYQVDQFAYMVTLTNGPFEGSRMRFESTISEEQRSSESQNYLAENHNVEVGGFGEENLNESSVESQEVSVETAQTFNFSNSTI